MIFSWFELMFLIHAIARLFVLRCVYMVCASWTCVYAACTGRIRHVRIVCANAFCAYIQAYANADVRICSVPMRTCVGIVHVLKAYKMAGALKRFGRGGWI